MEEAEHAVATLEGVLENALAAFDEENKASVKAFLLYIFSLGYLNHARIHHARCCGRDTAMAEESGVFARRARIACALRGAHAAARP